MYRAGSLLIVCILVCSSCATPGTSGFRSVPPTAHSVENEIVVDAPFAVVWDRLVSRLSKSFFVVNNIDKESHFINVSFSVDSPDAYVDCGRSHRTYSRGTDKQEYDYPVAASSSYRYAGSSGIYPSTAYIDRKTRLEGRLNIYVAPDSAVTRVSVTGKFILQINVSGHYVVENLLGSPISQGQVPTSESTVDFTTNQPGTVGSGDKAITCASTGALEREVLDFVRP
jgi:hypothetical protein